MINVIGNDDTQDTDGWRSCTYGNKMEIIIHVACIAFAVFIIFWDRDTFFKNNEKKC